MIFITIPVTPDDSKSPRRRRSIKHVKGIMKKGIMTMKEMEPK